MYSNTTTLSNIAPIYITKCKKPDDVDDGQNPFHSQLLSFPSSAYLELTPACNNRCLGCSNDEFVANYATRELKPIFHHRPLNSKEWDMVLDKLGHTLTFANITGGEPTLHPDFSEIVTSLDHRGVDFAVFTNGRWHQPEWLVHFLAGLSHFRGFLISLHGASEKTHETFSGVSGSFQETVSNIMLALRTGLSVTMSTVITHQNILELKEIAGLSQRLGVKETVFNRYLIPTLRESQPIPGGTLKQMIPSQQELKEAVWTIENLRDTYQDSLQISYGPCIPQCFVPSSSQGCSAGDNFLVVDPWGNVKPCTDSILLCGNLLQQTLEEVWWSEEMEYWRKLIPDGCTSCTALSKCRTGCRAMAIASGLGHDPLMMEPLGSQSNPSVESSLLIPIGVSLDAMV